MAPQPTILIADRDPNGPLASCDQLDLHFDCSFKKIQSEKDLAGILTGNSAEILVIDIEFPNSSDGFSYIQSLRRRYPQTAILPVLPYSDPALINRIFALDLHHYLSKPFDLQETRLTLKKVWECQMVSHHFASQKHRSVQNTNFHGMIGGSKTMRKLFDLIAMVAEDDLSTVLIRGESGTGKEMVAKAIHSESLRRDKNFVPVNCAAIPDDLLESELFGYTKGAFTGATANKPGRIQYAHEGTLFLDEIGDMKSALQAKLLRVIQAKEFEPVGAFKSIPVDTRIIAATHCDLESMVGAGSFREDLYYRLSVIPIHIPPLRERREDIPLLIDYFLDKYARTRGREPFVFTDKALSAVLYYEWRGNVRELENLIQHMSVLSSGKTVDLADLPEKFQHVEIPEDARLPKQSDEDQDTIVTSTSSETMYSYVSWENGSIDFNGLINDFETKLILQALKISEGNKKEAARLLNLKRTTLLEKIKKKDIDGLWEEQN